MAQEKWLARVRPERRCPHGIARDQPKELPEDFEIFVQTEFLVASDHRDLFAHSLGNDLAVERVRVVWREIEKIESMMRRVGQYAKVQILKRALRVCGGKS